MSSRDYYVREELRQVWINRFYRRTRKRYVIFPNIRRAAEFMVKGN